MACHLHCLCHSVMTVRRNDGSVMIALLYTGTSLNPKTTRRPQYRHQTRNGCKCSCKFHHRSDRMTFAKIQATVITLKRKTAANHRLRFASHRVCKLQIKLIFGWIRFSDCFIVRTCVQFPSSPKTRSTTVR